MNTKTIIAHHKLSELVKNMPEVEALNKMSRLRTEADREGLCVTRLIVGGKVQEQTVWSRK